VKPGGRLVYAVCTVTPEENESVLSDFLAGHPDFIAAHPAVERGIPPSLVDEAGFFRTFPHRHGTDGFFGAGLLRTA
jgi:16S rRNA (cytosine967-C5)-methyltransferase